MPRTVLLTGRVPPTKQQQCDFDFPLEAEKMSCGCIGRWTATLANKTTFAPLRTSVPDVLCCPFPDQAEELEGGHRNPAGQLGDSRSWPGPDLGMWRRRGDRVWVGPQVARGRSALGRGGGPSHAGVLPVFPRRPGLGGSDSRRRRPV